MYVYIYIYKHLCIYINNLCIYIYIYVNIYIYIHLYHFGFVTTPLYFLHFVHTGDAVTQFSRRRRASHSRINCVSGWRTQYSLTAARRSSQRAAMASTRSILYLYRFGTENITDPPSFISLLGVTVSVSVFAFGFCFL